MLSLLENYSEDLIHAFYIIRLKSQFKTFSSSLGQPKRKKLILSEAMTVAIQLDEYI